MTPVNLVRAMGLSADLKSSINHLRPILGGDGLIVIEQSLLSLDLILQQESDMYPSIIQFPGLTPESFFRDPERLDQGPVPIHSIQLVDNRPDSPFLYDPEANKPVVVKPTDLLVDFAEKLYGERWNLAAQIYVNNLPKGGVLTELKLPTSRNVLSWTTDTPGEHPIYQRNEYVVVETEDAAFKLCTVVGAFGYQTGKIDSYRLRSCSPNSSPECRYKNFQAESLLYIYQRSPIACMVFNDAEF